MRYRHCLTQSKGDAMPKSIVSVDCEHCETLDRSNPRRLLRSLSSWHAVACILDRGQPGRIREAHGTDVASWWESLEWLLRRGGVTWVISCPAGRSMTLLGLWEGLEDGRLRIVGSDGGFRSVRHGNLPPVQGESALPLSRPRRSTSSNVRPVQGDTRDEPAGLGGDHDKGGPRSPAGYIVLEDPPTIVHCRVAYTTGTIHWVDSRNYGVTLGDPEKTAAERSRLLHKFALDMVGVLSERKLGGLKDTAGSQSMASFRRRHIQSVIVCHTVPEALDLEGRCYYGGRAEAHRIGNVPGTVFHLDYRSLYPSVCRDTALPVRLRCHTYDPDPDDAGRAAVLSNCAADVLLRTDGPDYPLRRGSIVVYPVGRFRTCLAGPELTHAVERSRVDRWYSLAEYDCEPALRTYALEMDGIRCAADEQKNRPLAQWAKSMGVCLPGKFAQRDRHWRIWGRCPPGGLFYDEWHKLGTSPPERWRTIAGVTQWEEVGGWSNDAVPAIAAWITSAARLKLLAAIEAAGWENVYYVDTDSVFTNKEGYERLLDFGNVASGQMGYLKLEGVYSNFEVRGIKDYTADGRHVVSGLPKGSRDEPGDHDSYWWTPWIGLASRSHRRPTADAVLKHYKRVQPYRHGEILANGKVVPLQVWE